MAATLSGTYTSAPDTPSPVFPDRLIRPLPKRPIRSRLSPELAESILYPPAPPVTQLFYGSDWAGNGEVVNGGKVFMQRDSYAFDQDSEDDIEVYAVGADSEEDGPPVARRSLGRAPPSLSEYGKHTGTTSKASSNSLDGYDAFENTNNKKKRKIPTSGGLGCHSSLSADILGMNPTGPNGANSGILEEASMPGSYYGSGNPVSPSASGLSGPGRGRYSRNVVRSANGRAPLANSSNNWVGNRPGGSRRGFNHDTAYPSSSPKQGGNISLLNESTKPAPAKTQFTFTCESDSSKGMASWQTQNAYSLSQPPRPVSQSGAASAAAGQRRFSTQGTQTSPNMTSQVNQHSQAAAAVAPQHANQPAQPSAQGKKPRRSARSIYAFAARQRRIQQQYTNLHHPPNLEDIWICEFCEYESIFGHPPEALIRQYEIKDRKERRRLAEKRRLLEKAKMKGRKGKKPPKNSAKNAAAQQPAYQQNYDRQAMPEQPMEGQGDQEEDYLGIMEGDEYEEQAPQFRHPPQAGPARVPPPPGHNHPNQSNSQSNDGLAGGGTGRAG
ncbi:predicted protein [Uncinocarpus reesii 1704]|uniref:Uncharacterized protein n=1 Tax=Uncinocarpus reesii (strain UAMH 1704) TaxID=336963 RepID=C4JLL6_UNCRE|nr:uncharacterized protein UREG_03724 [Uncinocarpus reesii 1704]EEP78878.1 predicted protein [Uncinocarpus reesii 1704]